MQCDILDWILEQTENLTRETSEIQVKPVVYLITLSNVNFLILTNVSCLG